MANPRTFTKFPTPGTPVRNSTKLFWHSGKHPLHDHRSTEALPENEVIDILIIGAGYAGVATAYNLVKDSTSNSFSKLSVMILEARLVCSGATARNGNTKNLDMSTILY
ncbi:hypothetical protein EYC84_003723 [Monilinia fructicola]|uniref:FAD dependent oxidoreductase domain-containing protein n=1 Tax=Monilinia fructicola TaxID=38448 RepID=A0A5M9JUM5_MONFR|nr:hypothetical protein EYC84_003723 [Monilinia fructicola]